MVVIWTAGKLFRSLHLPVVLGELLGGIIVGPAMLGIVYPSEVITVIAELGIFFLMLHAGLETDFRALMRASKQSVIIELGSFTLSSAAAFVVCTSLGVPSLPALFASMCIAVASIAFVARFLKDAKLTKLPIANTLVATAILSDIFGLVGLSLLLKIHAAEQVSVLVAVAFTAKIVSFFIVVLLGGFMVSPWLHRFIYFGNKGFTLTLIGALIVGLAAEKVGLHFIIGAFLVGLFISAKTIDTRTYEKIEDRVYALSYSFFGPVFFASLAFDLQLDVLTAVFPLIVLLVLSVFIVRWLSTAALSVLFGFSWSESSLAGLLLNARGGSVGLILAVIGLKAEVLSRELFSVVLVVILLTTFLAIPLCSKLAKQLR